MVIAVFFIIFLLKTMIGFPLSIETRPSAFEYLQKNGLINFLIQNNASLDNKKEFFSMKFAELHDANPEKTLFSRENSCFFYENQCFSNYEQPENDEDLESLMNFLDKSSNRDPVQKLRQDSENEILNKGKSDEIQKNLKFQPEKLVLNDLVNLMPINRIINVRNKAKVAITLTVIGIDDLQITLGDSRDSYHIKEGKKIEINLRISPVFIKKIDCKVFFLIEFAKGNQDPMIFGYEILANIIPNIYGLKPIIKKDAIEGVSNKIRVFVTNPSNKKIIINQAFVSSSKTMNLTLPHYKIENYNKKIIEDLKQGNSPAFISYKYLNIDLQHLWEINPFAKKNILEINFKSLEIKDFENMLFLNLGDNEIIEIPVIVEFQEKGLNLNRKFIDFGVFLEKNQIASQAEIWGFNNINETYEIVDIVSNYDKDLYLQIYKAEEELLINPYEESRLLFKLVILPQKNVFQKIYYGKVLIIYKTSSNIFGLKQLKFKIANIQDFLYHDRFLEKIDHNSTLFFDKELKIYNTFLSSLSVDEIILSTSFNLKNSHFFLKINDFQHEIVLEKLKLEPIFRVFIRISNFPEKIDVFFNLIFSFVFNLKIANFYYPIPLFFYEPKIFCVFYRISIFMRTFLQRIPCQSLELELGLLKIKETRKFQLFIENVNPEELHFRDLGLIGLSKIILELDVFREDSKKNLTFLSKIAKNTAFSINPNEFLCLTFTLTSLKEELKNGSLEFSMNEKSYRIPMNYQSFQGNLVFIPKIILFDPGFPGFAQIRTISTRSTFSRNFKILNIRSEDRLLMPMILNETIYANSRTNLFQIIFDPGMNEELKFKMKGKNNWTKIMIKDLYLYIENQKKLENMMNRTDPNIFIETDIIQELKLQAIAYLQKPSLFKEEVLDLHIREVHEQHPINITIINPSDHPLEVSLFLGPEEFANFTIIQQVLMRYFGGEITPEREIICIRDESFKGDIELKLLFSQKLKDLFLTIEDDFQLSKAKDSYKKLAFYPQKDPITVSYEDLKSQLSRPYIDFLLQNKTLLCKKGLLSSEIRFFLKRSDYSLDSLLYSIFSNLSFIDFIYSHEYFIREIEEILEFSAKKAKFFTKPISKASLFDKTLDFLSKIMNPAKNRPFWNSRQAFFLKTSLLNKSYILPAHSNISLESLFFYPLQEKSYNLTLILKNNLTGLYFLPLTGKGEISRLVISKITKSEFFPYFYENRNFFHEEDRNKLSFDLESQEFAYYSEKTIEITRVFTMKNIGNLLIYVKKVSIENCGCFCQGFKVVNCSSFAISPNEDFDLTIIYYPDFIETNQRKKAFFYINEKIEVFWLEVNYNMEIMRLIPDYEYYYRDFYGILEKIRLFTIISSLFAILLIIRRFKEIVLKKKVNIESFFSNNENEELNIARLSRNIVKFKTFNRKVKSDLNFLEKNPSKSLKTEEKNEAFLVKDEINEEKHVSSVNSSKSDEILDSDGEIINETEIKQTFFGVIGEKAQKKQEKTQENQEKQYLYNYFWNNDEKSKHFSLLLGEYQYSSEENKIGESDYGEESSFTSENSANLMIFAKKNN